MTSGVVFGQIAERIMAKNLFLSYHEAKDTVKSMLPIIKHGNLSSTKYLLDRLNIDYQGRANDSEKNPDWGRVQNNVDEIKLEKSDIQEGVVPNVIGMGAKDAVYLMKKAGLNVGITGRGRVSEQSIPAGRKSNKGSYVSLTLKP